MTSGREDSRAALPLNGAGSQRLQALAKEALERAGLPPYPDPLALALALGRTLRLRTRAEERATLDGYCINYLWVPDDPRETQLNVFVGDALAVFEDAGIVNARPEDVWRLAGYLALSDVGVPPEMELSLQPHAPPWCLREHQKRRRWDRWSASGIFAAVGRTVNVP